MSEIDEALNALEVHPRSTRRHELSPGGLLPLLDGSITLGYVVDGEITIDASAVRGCRLDLSNETASTSLGARTLLTGDAFILMGLRPMALESRSGAHVMISELKLDGEPGALPPLPDFAYVTGFARSEPAAAALAANMGLAECSEVELRSGDPVICRMMATTVLLSLVRAWAENGCAPQGWPARTDDPYLGRVVDAIHAAPGKDWNLEQLAILGAMSRSVFTERFREAFGQSPAKYVTQVRMAAAKSLLSDGRTIAATSRELGYTSDDGFSRAFRRHTGVAPSAWRSERFDSPNSTAPANSIAAPNA